MPLNIESKTSYYQFDSRGLLWVPSDQSWEGRSLWKKFWDWAFRRSWVPSWSNKSKRDTIGRTVLAGLAYGFTDEMIEGLESCYRDEVLYRHPDLDEVASRDHYSYFYIYRRWTNQELPNFPKMRGMNLWMKTLTGNKRAEWWYYFWQIPGAYLGNWWLKTCRRIGGIGNEWSNREWITYAQDGTVGQYVIWNRTPWQKLWSKIINTTIPAYALHNKAWQIYVMPTSKRKEKLKRILLKRAGKSNLMLRLLFGDKVTQEEIDNYPHMTGYRPGAYLNTTTRTIREMDAVESEYNTYEKQLIKWLYDK
jgi:hypothetical protein